MSDPVDIKIARIKKSEDVGKSIDKDKVHEVFQTSMTNWSHFIDYNKTG